MKVENVRIYDFYESVCASKYPMVVHTNDCNEEVTERVCALASGQKGEGHDNFLCGILVAFDLTFTNKAWIEAERYHFFQPVSLQSTMHRISKFDLANQYNEYVDPRMVNIMTELKNIYNQTNDADDYLKLLYSNPAGFELTGRITTNYRQLKTIYAQRHNHRLPEWREFCDWIETLPWAKELITGGNTND